MRSSCTWTPGAVLLFFIEDSENERYRAAALHNPRALFTSPSVWIVCPGGVQGTAWRTVPAALGERG